MTDYEVFINLLDKNGIYHHESDKSKYKSYKDLHKGLIGLAKIPYSLS